MVQEGGGRPSSMHSHYPTGATGASAATATPLPPCLLPHPATAFPLLHPLIPQADLASTQGPRAPPPPPSTPLAAAKPPPLPTFYLSPYQIRPDLAANPLNLLLRSGPPLFPSPSPRQIRPDLAISPRLPLLRQLSSLASRPSCHTSLSPLASAQPSSSPRHARSWPDPAKSGGYPFILLRFSSSLRPDLRPGGVGRVPSFAQPTGQGGLNPQP